MFKHIMLNYVDISQGWFPIVRKLLKMSIASQDLLDPHHLFLRCHPSPTHQSPNAQRRRALHLCLLCRRHRYHIQTGGQGVGRLCIFIKRGAIILYPEQTDPFGRANQGRRRPSPSENELHDGA